MVIKQAFTALESMKKIVLFDFSSRYYQEV